MTGLIFRLWYSHLIESYIKTLESLFFLARGKIELVTNTLLLLEPSFWIIIFPALAINLIPFFALLAKTKDQES